MQLQEGVVSRTIILSSTREKFLLDGAKVVAPGTNEELGLPSSLMRCYLWYSITWKKILSWPMSNLDGIKKVLK